MPTTWEQTLQVGSAPSVRIEQNSGGDVKIRGWDQPTSKVTASGSGGEQLGDRLDVRASTGELTLEVRPARNGWFSRGSRSEGLHVEVWVPRGSHCEVESGSGRVDISGVHSAHAEAGSGSVSVSDIAGPVRVETGSGNVSVQRVGAGVEVEAGSGNLHVEAVMGSAELETGSGSVMVRQVQGQRFSLETGGGHVSLKELDVEYLEVESGSGNVVAELSTIHRRGDYRIETGSGGVTVHIPPDADLDLDMEASSGRIRHEGLTFTEIRAEDEEWEARMGRGGPRLSVEANSGTILLKPYQGTARQGGAVSPVPSPAKLMRVLEEDPVLSNSEQVKRVLRMVEEGKLTPEEAEQIIAALEEEADLA